MIFTSSFKDIFISGDNSTAMLFISYTGDGEDKVVDIRDMLDGLDDQGGAYARKHFYVFLIGNSIFRYKYELVAEAAVSYDLVKGTSSDLARMDYV